jgi:hypothetical protein
MGSMRIDPERAALILGMLTEGSSIRSAERLTGTHRDTICRLLRFAGEKAERLMGALIRNVEVKDVQADEIWSNSAMKEAPGGRPTAIGQPAVGQRADPTQETSSLVEWLYEDDARAAG